MNWNTISGHCKAKTQNIPPNQKNKTDSSTQKAIVYEELLHKSQNDYCITKPKSTLHTTPKGHCKKRKKKDICIPDQNDHCIRDENGLHIHNQNGLA